MTALVINFPSARSPSAQLSARKCSAFSFDALAFNVALQTHAADHSWGNEQPAAISEYAGQAPQKFNGGTKRA